MSIEIKRPDFDDPCRRERREDEETCCVCKVVKFIDRIQRKFSQSCCISCEAPRLGENVPGVSAFNTRPIILYTEEGAPFAIIPDPIGDPTTTTNIFRVESVDNCCAILRALVVEDDVLVGTNSCVTVDLCEFVGIQCLADVFIGCT
ncbi:MAG TPA: CotY/CotZ family spore coat protein, partial [Haloplasmataceae bacterium]